jgi:hypothetical protein
MTDDMPMTAAPFPTSTIFRSLRSSWPTVSVERSLLTFEISLKISVLKKKPAAGTFSTGDQYYDLIFF